MSKQKHIFITKDCIKSYELGKKQGAVEELKNVRINIFEVFKYSNERINIVNRIDERIRELEGVLKDD